MYMYKPPNELFFKGNKTMLRLNTNFGWVRVMLSKKIMSKCVIYENNYSFFPSVFDICMQQLFSMYVESNSCALLAYKRPRVRSIIFRWQFSNGRLRHESLLTFLEAHETDRGLWKVACLCPGKSALKGQGPDSH